MRGVKGQGGRGGRRGTLVRVTGAVALVAALIYWEQTALLYVLSTLAMCGLLLVVAFSDLRGRDKELMKATQQEKTTLDSAGEMTTAAAPRSERRVARRKRREAA